MSYRTLTLEEAEAKLLASFTNLIWIIPGLFLLGLILNYVNGTSIVWGGEDLSSIFKGLLWLIFGLRVLRLVEKELSERRMAKV